MRTSKRNKLQVLDDATKNRWKSAKEGWAPDEGTVDTSWP
jgi:hypothetical protein